MKIGIYSNPHKDEAGGHAKALCKLLDKYHAEYYLCANEKFSLDCAGAVPDVVVAFGGDGTMLRAVSECSQKSVPILGVNLGKVGFLTEIGCENLQEAAKKLLNGEYFVEKRIMLQIVSGDKKYYALNEAALSGSLCRVAEVTVEIDGTLADKVRADGMLVSTPTGSTA